MAFFSRHSNLLASEATLLRVAHFAQNLRQAPDYTAGSPFSSVLVKLCHKNAKRMCSGLTSSWITSSPILEHLNACDFRWSRNLLKLPVGYQQWSSDRLRSNSHLHDCRALYWTCLLTASRLRHLCCVTYSFPCDKVRQQREPFTITDRRVVNTTVPKDYIFSRWQR